VVLTLEATNRHTAARDPLTVVASHWLVVLVRVWRDGDRQMIRLIARTESDDISCVAVESSNRAAADRLLTWLDEFGRTSSTEAGDDKTADKAEMTE
jgi:hypothetical protein